MDLSVGELETRDFTEMEHTLSAWDHRYRQISPGAFRGKLLLTQVGSLGIFRNRWERAIHYRGVAPEGTIGLAISLAQSGEARWLGQRAGVNSVIIQRCGAEAEYLSAPLWDSVVFTIPETQLAQKIADITHDDPSRVLHAHGVVHLKPKVAELLRRLCLDYLRVAERVQANPEAALLLLEMAERTLDVLTHALVSSQLPHEATPRLSRQRQLIHQAEEYVEHLANQPLRIGELCRAVGASERTLRDVFYRVADTSPLVYLKAQQLNRVYRVLHASDPNEVLVKQVALAHGFTHLGQFCRDYKTLFGERPSDTLQRW